MHTVYQVLEVAGVIAGAVAVLLGCCGFVCRNIPDNVD